MPRTVCWQLLGLTASVKGRFTTQDRHSGPAREQQSCGGDQMAQGSAANGMCNLLRAGHPTTKPPAPDPPYPCVAAEGFRSQSPKKRSKSVLMFPESAAERPSGVEAKAGEAQSCRVSVTLPVGLKGCVRFNNVAISGATTVSPPGQPSRRSTGGLHRSLRSIHWATMGGTMFALTKPAGVGTGAARRGIWNIATADTETSQAS